MVGSGAEAGREAVAEAAEDLVVVEQVSWLVEHQRGRCDGATALTSFQGLLNDEIIVPQSAVDATDPMHLIRAVDGFVDALQNHAYLIVGEFAPEALGSTHAHDYVTQAKAGGHAQYYALRGGDPLVLRSCAAALKSMLADPHLEIFNAMLRLKRSHPRDARRFAQKLGFSSIATALRDLDKRFNELEQKEPLAPRHKAWLKSFRKLNACPDAELVQHIQRIAAANKLFGARRGEAERARAEKERSDPTFKSVRALCEMAGLQFRGLGPGGFAPLRSVWPEGPDRRAFGFHVDTDRGQRAALFYADGGLFKRQLAVLIQPGEPLPLGSLRLSREDFSTIVPG